MKGDKESTEVQATGGGSAGWWITVVVVVIVGGILSSEKGDWSCGGSGGEGGEDEAITVVKGSVPPKYEGLSYSVTKNADGTTTVSSDQWRWKVKDGRACAENGAAKTLTPSVPFCSQVNW